MRGLRRPLRMTRTGKVVSLLLLAALIALIAWVFDPYRTISLTRALSPAYWVLRWEGRDRYDARNALLEQGDGSVPEVALTFDDGPDPQYGPAIARLLQQRKVKATFFVIGFRVKQYPQVLRELVADGFEIGNHTYDHQRLPALKPHEIANELRLGDRDIYAVTGIHTTLMRPPGVQYDDTVLHIAKSLGYVTVSWTVGARDYGAEPSPAFITQRVLDRTGPGAIILLHQTSPQTLAALPAIIDGLRARGYRFVTISEMLARLHVRRPLTGGAS